MITHAAFPKTLLYCFIGPPPTAVFFASGETSRYVKENAKFVYTDARNRLRFNKGRDFTSFLEK